MFEAQRKGKTGKKRSQSDSVAAPLQARLKDMAGLPQQGYDSRDPVSHVQDVFFTSFAAHGRAMAQLERSLPLVQAPAPAQEQPGGQEWTGGQEQGNVPGQTPVQAPARLPTGGMEERYQSSPLSYSQGRFIHRFADTAFSRGDLAAGILQGKGKMMLASTMKQAIGQSPPDNEREKKLWSNTSAHKKLPGGDAVAVFNKGDVHSAVALIVDSIASGRNALNDMRDAAIVCRKAGGNDTLAKLYPFLRVQEDKRTLKHIQAQLQHINSKDDPEKKRLLEYGAMKMQALIQKKEAMSLKFIQLIDSLSINAQRAEMEFQESGFSDQLFRELYAYAPLDGDAEGNPAPEEGEGGFPPADEADEQPKSRRKGSRKESDDATA